MGVCFFFANKEAPPLTSQLSGDLWGAHRIDRLLNIKGPLKKNCNAAIKMFCAILIYDRCFLIKCNSARYNFNSNE